MQNNKILFLGNEFIGEDSLAVKISNELKKEKGDLEFVHIKDTFTLMDHLRDNQDAVIIDVVQGLNEVKILKVEDLKFDNVLTAHDLDASFILQLLGEGKNIKIIGIPQFGNFEEIKKGIQSHLTFKK